MVLDWQPSTPIRTGPLHGRDLALDCLRPQFHRHPTDPVIAYERVPHLRPGGKVRFQQADA